MTKKKNLSDFDKRMAPLAGGGRPLMWIDPCKPPFRLAGFPWYEKDKLFRRMPSAIKDVLPEAVNYLAECTAGGQIAFQSDTKHLAVRVNLAGRADMNHMPATGQCGFDLYIGQPFRQRFHNVTKYNHWRTSYECLLFEHPNAEMRSFTLNFPLYKGVKRVQIGLTPGARIKQALPYAMNGRIVVYGTSITQGGCASRPGMAYTNILSRALNIEFVNLGFSGSGKGEAEVAEAVADVPNPLLFILDYEANAMGLSKYKQTLPRFVNILRSQHKNIPILITSKIPYARDVTHKESLLNRQKSKDMQARLVKKLRKSGDRHIHFFDGSALLGDDDFDECTVDGAHPTDLGFFRIAKGLEYVIRNILKIESKKFSPHN